MNLGRIKKTDLAMEKFRKELSEMRMEIRSVGAVAKAAETKVKETETMARATETKLETVVESCLVEGIEKSMESKFNDSQGRERGCG